MASGLIDILFLMRSKFKFLIGQANSLKRKSEPSADPISPSPAVKRPREVIEEDNEIVCLE